MRYQNRENNLSKNGEGNTAILFNARHMMDYYDYHGTIISSSSGSNRISFIDRETGRYPQKILPNLKRNFRTVEGLDN
jgi:hypothetical protein